jgi:hypothetical protein
LVSQILSRSGPDRLLGGTRDHVSDDEAEQVSPEQVEAVAREAEQRDPGVIDRLSQVYSEHPTLIKTVGGLSLAYIMSRLADRQRNA